MIDKRLIGMVPQSKKTIAANVALQWGALCANIVLMGALALGRVPYDRWWKFIWKLLLIFLLLTAAFLAVSAVF